MEVFQFSPFCLSLSYNYSAVKKKLVFLRRKIIYMCVYVYTYIYIHTHISFLFVNTHTYTHTFTSTKHKVATGILVLRNKTEVELRAPGQKRSSIKN